MKDLISIIVPVYNCENYISKCLDSLVSQTYKHIEIILVNDGSTDNSVDICKKYQNLDSRVKIYEKENSGPSLTRRFGFQNISPDSKFVMFIDSDDWMDIDMCEYLLKIQKKYNSDITCCDYYINDYSEKKKEKIFEFKNNENIIEEYLSNANIKGCCWNKLYKVEVIKKEFFNDTLRYGEDILFVCNTLLLCSNVVSSNQPKYHYNVSNTSLTRSIVSYKKIKDNYIAHKKQVELINSKYKKNIDLNMKAQEKLYDSLLLIYSEIMAEKEKNENEDYLVSLIKKTYQKNIKISSIKKLKLFLIAYFNVFVKIIYKLKKNVFFMGIYIMIFISILLLVSFPMFCRKANQITSDKIKEEVLTAINNNYKKSDFEKLGYEKVNVFHTNNEVEILAYRDGYCITKLARNSNISVFASAKDNCYLDNSPEIKYYSGSNINISGVNNPIIKNYIIYGEMNQSGVIEKTILKIENNSIKNIIAINLYVNGIKNTFEINLGNHESLKRIGTTSDYIDFNEQMIVRKIGTMELNGEEKIVYLKKYSNKYNLFVIKKEGFDQEIYLQLDNELYKDENDLYNAISLAKDNNKILKVYHILDKKVKEQINLPEFNIDFDSQDIVINSDNNIKLLVYSQN